MRYLLDANTYIQAKNQYYGMDICPAYWDWLDKQFALGIIASVDMIGRELKEGNDELASWVRERPDHFISNDDELTQTLFADIVQFVMEGDYNPGNRDNFLAKAITLFLKRQHIRLLRPASPPGIMLELERHHVIPSIRLNTQITRT